MKGGAKINAESQTNSGSRVVARDGTKLSIKGMSYSDRNYGEGDPNCPICNGVGYVRYDVPEDHPYFGKALDCECRRSRVTADRQNYLRRLGGLANLENKTFDTVKPQGVGLPERDAANLHYAYERAYAFAEQPDGWLVIMGGYGCGKTHLAAAIANTQVDLGHKVIFLTVPDLLDHLRGSYSPGAIDDDSYDRRFEEVRTTPLLILDDLGTESPTPWAREKLFQILNHRYTARLATVLTTNRNFDELEPRIRSRLSDPDVSERIVISARDYRAAEAGSVQSDMSGLALYSYMTFDNINLRRDLPKDDQANLRRAVDTARDFADNPQGWLVLMGPYGSGKTHLAAAIGNVQAAQGTAVLFVTVPDLLDYLRATFAPNSNVSYDKRFNQVKTAPLLILDDLGLDSATPWAREKLHQILNYRYNARLATVITTSHTPEELDKADVRLTTRIRDQRLCRIFELHVPAYRGDR